MRATSARPVDRSGAPGTTSSWQTVTAILTRRWVTAPSLVLALVTASVPVLAAPATAAVIPVTDPHSIEVFATVDMVGAAGFDEPFVVEVWRDGVKVGDSGAPVSSALLELNHAGPPCWAGTTPDIIAGDEVRVVTDSSDPDNPVGEFTTVADLDADTPALVALDPDGVANDLVMTGRARDADGTGPLPVARMAAEVVQPAFRDAADVTWERRAIRAVTGVPLPDATTVFDQEDSGVLQYDPLGAGNPDGTRWTATWKNLPGSIGALALGGEHTISSWEREDAAGEAIGMTIMDAEDLSGPSAGCPAGATDAVTATSPQHVNIAARQAGGDLVVSGVSYNAAAARVTVDDTDATTTDAITVPAVVSNPAPTETTSTAVPGRQQTWTARVPMSSITGGDLDDGELTISGSYDRVIEERVDDVTYTHTAAEIGGRDRTIRKDLTAPAAPAVFPAGGRYYGAQNVTATAADPAEETIRYTVGGATAAEPAAASAVLPAPYGVTQSQQLRVAAYDRAGNRSTTVTQTYDVRSPSAPGAPGRPTAVAGNGAATLSWTAPADTGGHSVTAYRVRAYNAAGALVRQLETAGTRMVFGGLPNGRAYSFDVRAVNAIGAGTASARGGVTLRERTAPRVVARTPGVNATGVRRTRNVTVRFSEPVTRLSGATVRLTRVSNGAVVSGTLSYHAATRTMTVNPYGGGSRKLLANTRYRVTLSSGIRDRVGNALPATSWTFTTGRT